MNRYVLSEVEAWLREHYASTSPETLMPFNRGTRHKPKWVGHVKYKGRKKWVGSTRAWRTTARPRNDA